MIIAKTYNQLGVGVLRGLPVQNNLPLTNEPDYYLNWPPLFPILLSYLLDFTGNIPQKIHLFMAGVATLSAIVVSLSVYIFYGTRAALITAITYFCLPVITKYGFAIMHIHLAMLFVLIAHLNWLLWIKTKLWRYVFIGAFSLGLGAVTSWEAALYMPGLFLAIYLVKKNQKHNLYAASIYLGSIVILIIFLFLLYILQVEWAKEQLLNRILFRMNVKSFGVEYFRVHALVDYLSGNASIEKSFFKYIVAICRSVIMNGILPVLAIIYFCFLMFIKKAKNIKPCDYFLLLPLLTIPLIWSTFMANHFIWHEYEAINFAGLSAIVMGVIFYKLVPVEIKKGKGRLLQRLPLIIMASIGLVSFIHYENTTKKLYHNDRYVELGRFIKDNTTPESIIITSVESMVPVYYSDRHIIRGVHSGGTILKHAKKINNLCTSCDIYLAINLRDASQYSSYVKLQEVVKNKDFIIFKLSKAKQKIQPI